MLEIGKAYKFRVRGSFLNRKEEKMFQIELADEPDGETYVTLPILSQRGNKLPGFVFCKVIRYDESDHPRLVQTL